MRRGNLLASLLAVFFLVMCSVTFFGVEIKYNFDGKTYIVKGEKIKSGKYIFNKGKSKKISLVTLDWPPYVAEQINGQGWVQQVVVGIFLSQGYAVTSEFVP